MTTTATTEGTVLVLGALSAMAMETTRIMAGRGRKFCLVARSEDKLKVFADDLIARGAQAVTWLIMDIAAAANGESLIARAEAQSGPIDTVLLAWGMLGDQARAEKELAYAVQLLDANFNQQATCLLGIAKVFEERKRGLIIVITSVAGDRGRQSNYIYGCAKGALSLFLQGLRNRLQKSGVHVLTVKPGFVASPMTKNFNQGPLYVNPDIVAQGIMRAVDRRRNSVYLPWFWLPIMFVIKLIPEAVFKKLSL